MNDSKSASLVLVAGAVGVAYWWWSLNHGKLAPPTASGGATGAPEPGAAKGPEAAAGAPLARLEAFARAWGLTINSGLRPGDTGSLHSEGRAIDVAMPSPGLLEQVKRAARALGIHVLVEDYTGTRPTGRSTGPHVHLSFPRVKNGRLVW